MLVVVVSSSCYVSASNSEGDLQCWEGFNDVVDSASTEDIVGSSEDCCAYTQRFDGADCSDYTVSYSDTKIVVRGIIFQIGNRFNPLIFLLYLFPEIFLKILIEINPISLIIHSLNQLLQLHEIPMNSKIIPIDIDSKGVRPAVELNPIIIHQQLEVS